MAKARGARWPLLRPLAIVIVAAVVGLALIIYSLVRTGADAESKLRAPIPSTTTVHLGSKTYAVSYAAPRSLGQVRRPNLVVTISPTGGGAALGLHDPQKRLIVSTHRDLITELHLFHVQKAGSYDIAVTSDKRTDGFVAIGDPPLSGPKHAFIWLIVLLLIAVPLSVVVLLRSKISVNVKIGRNQATNDGR